MTLQIDFGTDLDAGALLKYEFLLSLNHGNETLVCDERYSNKCIEIGLSKPSDWDDNDWLYEPAETEYRIKIFGEGDKDEAGKGKEEGIKGGHNEAAPTGIDEVTNALNDSTIESLSPLPAYLRFQWGPNAEYQAFFRCNLPTLAPEAFQVELHRLRPGLEDQRPYDISIYARSDDHGDEIILDDNGIPLLVVFMEWCRGGGTRFGSVTRAYAKRIIDHEVPVLSSEEIGRMLGPWKKILREDVWKVDSTVEESWMKGGALKAWASTHT